ncbi:MAG: single-stranded DNA-binding protein [Mizugakiibacter sp.]|uniref:single-stranded DNA-binding protein n=1 Tax=Mizugakiibacter sp. TaxID=1972610 RepID=UPI00320E39EA
MSARSLNRGELIGNLGSSPEVRYTADGKAVCEIGVATTEQVRRGDDWISETEWHRAKFWGALAERLGKHGRKGAQVWLEGRLRTEKWTDRDGVDRFTTKIVVENFFFLGAAPESHHSEGSRG